VQEIGLNILSKPKEERPFEDFISLLYDDKLQKKTFETLTEYQKFIGQSQTGGSTNFRIVFNEIVDLVRKKTPQGKTGYINKVKELFTGPTQVEGSGTVEELTVIFFTDGCDTCNQKNALL
jgi:hypothetical protein